MLERRWNSLDVVKALMVPVMIVVHNVIWWLSYHPQFIDKALNSWFIIFSYLSQLVLLIPATAGAALFFYLKQHRSSELPPFKTIAYRALTLVAIGFLMNITAFGAGTLFQWNVLQFFALSLVIIYVLLLTAPHWVLLVVGSLTLFGAPLLRELFSAYTDNYVVAVLIGEPTNIHLWPLLPWFAVVVMGFWVARTLYTDGGATGRTAFTIAVGSIIIFVSAALGKLSLEIDFSNLWGETIFQPSTARMLGTIGIGLVLLGCTHWLMRGRAVTQYGIIQSFSYGLFYIYVIHMIVGHQLQKLVLQYYDHVSLLWLVIALQVVGAYFIGVAVIYLKLREKRVTL